MNVYFTAATSTAAKTPSKQTALMLGQQIDLPYFRVFEQPLLDLPTLYRLIESQIEQTVQQAGWKIADLKDIPIFLGSTGYVITDCEARLAHNQALPAEPSIAVAGDYLRERYQTQVFSFATSCTSSAHGVNYAYKMIKNGVYNKALVIGFEMFNRLTFEHFHAMHLLSQSSDYLPFVEPSGIVLGEGLACVALSNQPHAQFEAEILGMTSLTDNENLTNNSEQALRTLLEQICYNANLEKEHIRGIKVHGVGGNADMMEMAVLQAFFPNSRWILAKPFLGHTLGASGAMETAFLLDGLKSKTCPDVLKNPENLPLAHGTTLENGYYLSYFLGFGGSNVGWGIRWNA